MTVLYGWFGWVPSHQHSLILNHLSQEAIRNVPNERSEWDISMSLCPKGTLGHFSLLSLAYVPMSLRDI